MPSDTTKMDPNWAKILIVDNEELVLSVLKEQLQPEGCQVTTANSGAEALEALQKDRFPVVLADHEMPEMSGLEFLTRVKELHPDAARVLLTSSLALPDLFKAIQSGVIHRYVAKPWLREELIAIIRNSVACNIPVPSPAAAVGAGVDLDGASAGEATGEAGTEGAVEGVFSSVEHADMAVEAFVRSLSIFHPNLGNTAARARVLCQTVAQMVGLPEEEAQGLVWAGALHDISLIGADRALVRRWLRSPDKCSQEEMALIKKHPQDTEEILEEYPIFKMASEVIHCHHENWDGTGYPDRLQGEAIPWVSRLLAPIIYFASKHQPLPQVLSDLGGQSDKMFDPKAVEVVAAAVPKTELPRGEREILLIELQAGMTLARDILSSSNVLILTKGKELTTAWINKINNINSATPLNPFVLVYC